MSKKSTAIGGIGGGLIGAIWVMAATFSVAFVVTAIFFILKVINGTAVNEQWPWASVFIPFYIWVALGIVVGIIGAVLGGIVGHGEDSTQAKLTRYQRSLNNKNRR